ncbi:NAD(P)H-dependent oxidoreductase subunit E [Amycolatopsis magusensis]|uniref:Formate dehydrogenase subunit gamma n=1 Tax=Amycolatopsis magusensis TaxID=882444 RepID=A0ABS4PU76_9PSEU|nr:NAD(P)H-dependent oxidoreductase subunit E [Amycolatopsis magusensis]MBP2182970.1 formate dehydrogenase subunit gamma [Amycolatopsis magusensis]
MSDMADRARAVVDAHRGDRGALLPVLHGLQAEFGYLDQALLPLVAKELNLSRADVHGVISFYTDFRTEPPGRTVVKLCRAEACQSVGAERLVAHAEQVLGSKVGQTTADGSVSSPTAAWWSTCTAEPARPQRQSSNSSRSMPRSSPWTTPLPCSALADAP